MEEQQKTFKDIPEGGKFYEKPNTVNGYRFLFTKQDGAFGVVGGGLNEDCMTQRFWPDQEVWTE
jgi:hypothetical protein